MTSQPPDQPGAVPTTVREEIAAHGDAQPAYSPARIRVTLLAILAIMGLAAVLGALSGLVARERRNETILPRRLEIYALYPDGSLRYLQQVSPADEQLVDDDIPPITQVVEIVGPPMGSPGDLVNVEHIGGMLARSEAFEDPDRPGWWRERFPIRRETGDGPYLIDMQLSGSPVLRPAGGSTQVELPLAPQDKFAQAVLVFAIPHELEAEISNGPAPYRSTLLGGWRVYYFDVTLLEAADTLGLHIDIPLGTPRPVDFTAQQIDRNR